MQLCAVVDVICLLVILF